MGSLERRLEVLEDRVPAKQPDHSDRSEVRARMRESLGRIAAYRRGELDPEEAAEVEAHIAAVGHQVAERRGEGTS